MKVEINTFGYSGDKNTGGDHSKEKEQSSFEVVKVLLFDFDDMISLECLDHEYDVDPEHLQGKVARGLEELAENRRVQVDEQPVVRLFVVQQVVKDGVSR